jgi:hypothetical protein
MFGFCNKMNKPARWQSVVSCYRRRIRGAEAMDKQGKNRKPYSSPQLRILTPEQAKLYLLGHASDGDKDAKEAKELFELLFGDTPSSHEDGK